MAKSKKGSFTSNKRDIESQKRTAQVGRIKEHRLGGPKIYSHDEILALQSTIGNQAIYRLLKSGAIQTKLEVSRPNDKCEQEADRVAKQVMSSTNIESDFPKPDMTDHLIPPIGEKGYLGPNFESDVKILANGGTPLPPGTKDFFERASVRISVKYVSTLAAKRYNLHKYCMLVLSL